MKAIPRTTVSSIKPLLDEAATSHNDAVISFISFQFSFSFGKVAAA